jgi:hypothetical protein
MIGIAHLTQLRLAPPELVSVAAEEGLPTLMLEKTEWRPAHPRR